MVSSTALLVVLFAQLFALSAARDLWLQSLPRCWQSCFSNTGDGCSSSSCVCETSADSDSYLRRAVSCAVSRCDADHGSLDLALGSLELLCAGIGSRIPKDTMDDAYAAASEADDQDSSSPRASASTTRNQKTSTAGDATAESTSTKTTSTRSRRATSTSTSAPASTPPRPTIEPSLPSLMLLPTSTLAAGSRGTGNSVGGNGSPFDSPGSPSPSMAPGALLVLGALAILYLRI